MFASHSRVVMRKCEFVASHVTKDILSHSIRYASNVFNRVFIAVFFFKILKEEGTHLICACH